jgi:hypothetical protein
LKLVDPIELTLDFAMLSSIEVPTRPTPDVVAR